MITATRPVRSANDAQPGNRHHPRRTTLGPGISTILTIVIAAYAIVTFLNGAAPDSALAQFAPVITIGTVTAISFIHGIRRYGLWRMLVFFAFAFAISWTYETISIATGFPFGNYTYSEVLGPQLGVVPLLIMPAYFAMAYLSWIIAHALLRKTTAAFRGTETVTVPLVAAFVMVMWDFAMDPTRATVDQTWVWEDGGGYFGVPVSNYLGWYLCVWTIFQLFALYLRALRARHPEDEAEITQTSHWLIPIALYAAVATEFIARMIFGGGEEITTPDGVTWTTEAIFQSQGLVTITTMLFVALLATFVVIRRPAANAVDER